MAGGLKTLFGQAHGWRRRVGLLGLAIGVAGVHTYLTTQLANRLAEAGATEAVPPRIEVAYVRDMALSTPPPAAGLAGAPALARHAAIPKVPPAARPASAPPDAASAPAAVAAPPSAPLESASAVVADESPASAPPLPIAASAVPGTAAIAAAMPASATASGGANPAVFEWPLSTRINYELTGYYRGDVNGSAQVQWIRSGSHYQVHLDLFVGARAAPIIRRSMSSDGEITAQGLAPRRYDQDTKVIMRDRSLVTVNFEPGVVVLANGQRRASVPGVQDTASQFVQLTYVFSTQPELLKIGSTVNIPLALPHKVDVWTYDVVEEETLHTAFGPLPTVHIKPRQLAPKAGELSVEIWFAPQLRYLPARIRITQEAGTYVDVIIDRLPETAGS